MELEQNVTITTPEGVKIDLTVAGMGSRIAASVIDSILQTVVLIVALLAVGGWIDSAASVAVLIGFYSLLAFLVFFGYPILTEVLWEGKTIGKAIVGLRVVRTDGGGVGFVASLIRNVIRLIDFLPGFYGVGFVVAMINKRGQRLGDLAADTMVVRLRKTGTRQNHTDRSFGLPLPPPARVPWDVSAVNAEEVAALRHYAARRSSLNYASRSRLVDTLYGNMRDKVVPTTQFTSKESFLLQIVAEKDRDR